jgi:hypothetical protein
MSLFLNAAVMGVSAAPGTGTIALGSALAGFQAFAAAGAIDGNTYSYRIDDGGNFELGTGVYTASGPTLSRSLVYSSTGALLNVSAAAIVSLVLLAGDVSPLVGSAKITSATASVGFVLPPGFSTFKINIRGLVLSAAGANLGYRLSGAGSGSIRSGASDYSNISFSNIGTSTGPTSAALSYGYLTSNQNDNAGAYPAHISASFNPGDTGQWATLIAMSFYRDNTPQLLSARFDSVYTGATSGAIGRANYIQLVPTSGTLNKATISIYGEA